MNIRPVSDLRNKFSEIENLVLKEDEAVYLTKNGYGSMVVMSIDKYSQMVDENEAIEKHFNNQNIDELLEQSEKEIKNPNTKYYSTKDVTEIVGRILNAKK